MTVIRGEHVVLLPVQERDHPLILAWQNDPEVAWWMDYERSFTLEVIHESEARAQVEGHPFLIEADGRPIGRIGLNKYRARDQVCSLYVVELWGLSTNERAFRSYGKVGLRMDGALRERSRKGDGLHDSRTIMSITREEFEALHPKHVAAQSLAATGRGASISSASSCHSFS